MTWDADRVDDRLEKLKAKLAPETVGLTLIRAGCFLAAYELIRTEVVDGVHGFFWCGFDEGSHLYDEGQYQKHVLSLNPKSKYRASCAWLIEMDALTVTDVDTLEAIYKHRQEIAHELPKLLIDPDFEVRTDLLVAAIECVRKLGVFWGSIEVSTNPDYDGQEVDVDGIKSGSYLLMEYLASIADLGPADAAVEPETD